MRDNEPSILYVKAGKVDDVSIKIQFIDNMSYVVCWFDYRSLNVLPGYLSTGV